MLPLAEILGIHPVQAYHIGRVLRRRFAEAPGGGIKLRPDHDNDCHEKKAPLDEPKRVKIRSAIAQSDIQTALSGEPLIDDAPKPVKQEPPIVWASVDRRGYSFLRSGQTVFIGSPRVIHPSNNSHYA